MTKAGRGLPRDAFGAGRVVYPLQICGGAMISKEKTGLKRQDKMGGTMSVTRIFVEKIPGFDVEAKQIQADLTENLGIKGIQALRLLHRYDVEGLSQQEQQAANRTIFSEPNVDRLYGEDLRFSEEWQVFAMEYLPGQYDQRADSAAQCVQLLTHGERPRVAAARVIAIKGEVSRAEMEKIRNYLINPIESRLASMEKPASLDMETEAPEDVEQVNGLIGWDDATLEKYYRGMGFAMTMDDLKFCRDYFKNEEKRDPYVTELKVIDTYWSDHCRHTTFFTSLTSIEIQKGKISHAIEQALKAYYDARRTVYGETDRPVSLMDMAVIGAKLLRGQGKLDDLDISEEINACSIEVPVEIDGKTEQWLVQFKNETHNHPTEIEPFGGAATCLGGAIRDPLSGRAYVYQAMRVTGSGDPRTPFEETLLGKLPTRMITTTAAAGYSAYGNQIGLATGQVTELYDEGYMAKRMEIGAVIGASPKQNVVRGVPQDGDVIVLLGGATGRDGCGGATGSSKAHTTDSIELCGAEVQKGNPPTERKIQRLFRNGAVSRLIKRCNDFGAGGVCVAIGELAAGLRIDLDRVPKKYEGLDGTELAISESQERMAVVLAPKDADAFIQAAREENLHAQVVAHVTAEPRLKMFWRGKPIVDLSRAFLDTNGVTQTAQAVIAAPDPKEYYRAMVPECLQGKPVTEAFYENLARLEVASQKGLAERFDASIGAGTVHMPFAGKYQLTPEEAMVAKIPLEKGETDDATAMSYGYIPGIARFSPFHGAAYAVTESLSKLAAVGADPLSARLTFQEYFERLRKEPARWGKPAAALLGALTAQLGLEVPAVGGKDSMSGSFESMDVPPTLVSFAVAMTKAGRTISAAFQQTGSTVVLLPLPEDDDTLLPDWDRLKAYYRAVFRMAERGQIRAASVVKEGGAAAAVAKMCFGNEIGFAFADHIQDERLLFAPASGALVLELNDVTAIDGGVQAIVLGETTGRSEITLARTAMPLKDLLRAWTGTLEPVFPTQAQPAALTHDIGLYTQRSRKAPAIKSAKPRVLIPVFPGTNCEVDTARAFARAGAQPEILVVKNLTPGDVEQTIEEMVRGIAQAQIVMLPGGFSGGDEPDGSGKFIATTFRNPKIRDAVSDLLEHRDGLMLGICNGFQALIKLGLVPYGKITELSQDAPTLTFNTIGRHVSRMVYTKAVSVKSPWLAGIDAGDVFAAPVSHGEGRFVADDAVMRQLIENGQVAFQYTTPDGQPSGDIAWNPNGSVCAVEGITSPDGRVLGKMAHSERFGRHLYKNVPGEKDQKLFESGVRYFK